MIRLYMHKWAHFMHMMINTWADFQEIGIAMTEEFLYDAIQFQSSMNHAAWFLEVCLVAFTYFYAVIGV